MKKIINLAMRAKPMWGRTHRPSSRAKRSALCTALALLVLVLAVPLARAQEIQIPANVQKLSAKAKETVEVTMDGPMLHWASKFLSAEDPDEARSAKLVANLKGIYVRSYEFDKDGSYSTADVEALRAQMNKSEWTKVVGVRSETDGDVDVFFKLENDKMAGIVVIAAEPRELTFVNINGPIEIDQLADLGGEFGVPRMHLKGLTKDKISKLQKEEALKHKVQKNAQKDAEEGDHQ
jgi:hypothetical protein